MRASRTCEGRVAELVHEGRAAALTREAVVGAQIRPKSPQRRSGVRLMLLEVGWPVAILPRAEEVAATGKKILQQNSMVFIFDQPK
ncbi:hypothetical protein U9M48_022740 [Paspalum notatum var. saurae]|uniref:Uncharacterized protein n=1 Tax=Paspalum notatum var. saurae TaxID=547442 RepID=A0AAQ3WV08_PASNO